MTVDEAAKKFINYDDPAYRLIVFVVEYSGNRLYAHTFSNMQGGTCNCCGDVPYAEDGCVIKVFNAVSGEVLYI